MHDPGSLHFDSCLHVHLNPWSLLLALTTLVAAYLGSSMFGHSRMLLLLPVVICCLVAEDGCRNPASRKPNFQMLVTSPDKEVYILL